MSLVYNERSWAIDLISELNAMVKNKSLEIARASGEAGLKNTKGFLFPDAILFGKNANVLMGWELKMPDTPIEDQEFYENAKKKANLLGTNSFLLWNGKSAKLYGRKNDAFHELKSWNESRLVDRKTMGLHHDYWIELLKLIINDLEFFFHSGEIPAAKLTTVLDENFIVEIINALYVEDSKVIKTEYQKSAKFRAEFDVWSHENGFDKKEERFEELAKLNVLSWINRFLFSHYLASKTPKAGLIFQIKSGVTIDEGLEILQKITNELDFSQIYSPGLGNDLISVAGWTGRLELNEFLTSANLQELPSEMFRKVLDNFTESSRRKGMGQYATPKVLARLLVRLSINDAAENFLDPCSGSGTFVKEAYDFKKELGVSASNSLDSLWASDKYQLPLQITTLNLVDEDARDKPLQIFKTDVFDLEAHEEFDFVDPKDFKLSISRSIPMMSAIVSNLPFIRFEGTDSRGPADVVEEIFQATNLSAAKKLGRADIYATIILQLWKLLEEDGVLGVVVSNSWMGTDWGKSFQELIFRYFKLESVIRSGNCRWFNNADIITNLLILKKKSEIGLDMDASVKFISTLIPIEEWNAEVVDQFILSVHSGESTELIRTRVTTSQNRSHVENAGYSIRANFYDCDWVEPFFSKSVPISDLFEVARGARRGWNPLFYPDNPSTIESEFLIPALKTTARQTSLIATPDSVAFCCEESLDELKKSKKNGALNWVKNFESQVNGKGEPLPEVLGQVDVFWYQMSSKEKANFVISMNPYENLSVLQLEPPAFVDQRLIRMNPLPGEKFDLELMHALLNCSLSLLGIELLGFERGLGVLDIGATSLRKNFRVLDASLLSDAQKDSIKSSFNKVKSRSMQPTIKDLDSKDRQDLDEKVLAAFGLEKYQKAIYETLVLAINERVNF